MTTNRPSNPRRQTAGTAVPQTPDPARRDGDDRAVPLGRLRADGRVPLPEADPHRQPGGPLGRAGSTRLHRQPSPRRLRSARRVAGMHGDLLGRPERMHGALDDFPMYDARPEA